jgi:hypothetical protein
MYSENSSAEINIFWSEEKMRPVLAKAGGAPGPVNIFLSCVSMQGEQQYPHSRQYFKV